MIYSIDRAKSFHKSTYSDAIQLFIEKCNLFVAQRYNATKENKNNKKKKVGTRCENAISHILSSKLRYVIIIKGLFPYSRATDIDY